MYSIILLYCIDALDATHLPVCLIVLDEFDWSVLITGTFGDNWYECVTVMNNGYGVADNI